MRPASECLPSGLPSGLGLRRGIRLLGRICEFDWPTLVPAGGPCNASFDCSTGWCIPPYSDGQFTGWTDGVCTLPCSGGNCPDGLRCVVLQAQSYCLPECLSTSQCRLGYVCYQSLVACLPDCNLGWPCETPYVCDQSGLCQSEPAQDPCSDVLNPTCLPSPCQTETAASGTCSSLAGGCECVANTPVDNPCSYAVNPQCTPGTCQLPNGQDGSCGWQFGQCACVAPEPPDSPCSSLSNPQCDPSPCQLPNGSTGKCGMQFIQCTCKTSGEWGGSLASQNTPGRMRYGTSLQ
ncbi:MAG: hypothetical protein GXP54_13100 [Deltaproteobacteria bacterium]|nr:hypothetical protein [Deltaproteobacteria bacterium]